MKYIFLFLNILFFSKKNFKKPVRRKIAIFDGDLSYLLLKYLKKNNVNIIHHRFTQRICRDCEINIFILLKNILLLRFSGKDYIETYIKFTQPKILITLNDNNLFFYKIKNQNMTKIAIQISYRSTQKDIFYNSKQLMSGGYNCDYFLVYNNHIGKIYKKYFKGEPIQIGSFRSNYNTKKKTKKKIDILYISSFKQETDDDFFIEEEKIKYGDYRKKEYELIENIKRYLLNNKSRKFTVLGCKAKTMSLEKTKWDKIMGSVPYRFIPQKMNRKTYSIVDSAKLIISLDSSLGYEALARKNVVCFFSMRPNNFPTNSSNFGWPEKKITSKGPFWTNSASYTEVERLLNNAQKINPSIFFNKPKIKKFIKGQIIYDNNNKIFSTFINNILNKK
jgi:surface carbohydrate biosynthesis protein